MIEPLGEPFRDVPPEPPRKIDGGREEEHHGCYQKERYTRNEAPLRPQKQRPFARGALEEQPGHGPRPPSSPS
eukprot:1676294-Pyramimonas_sp.AAC.1